MTINKIVLGTWPLSGDYGNIKNSEVEKILEFSFKNKFYEYDTAPSYGNGFIEFILGSIFAGEKKVKINTKFGNLPFEGKNFNLDDLKRSLDHSLKRLNKNKINVLFLHNPRLSEKEFTPIIELMKKLKKQSLIKSLGISLAKNFKYYPEILNNFDCIQEDASLLSTNFYNIKSKYIFGRSPYANGILTGSLYKKFTKKDHRAAWLNNKKRKYVISKSLKELDKLSNINLKDLAFYFVHYNDKLYKNIFGIKSIKHVKEIKNLLSKKKPKKFKKIETSIYNLNKIYFNVSEKEKDLLF